MIVKKLCLFVGFVFWSAIVNAAQDSDLQTFFNTLQSLKADFTQEVYGPRRELQQSTEGSVIVQRPGKFRWDYELPYEQHIVADGKKVWLYDVDLEQITIKPQDSTMANTPASLLSDADQLNKQFDVLAVVREGQDWFELIPKQADSGFEALFIMLEDLQMPGKASLLFWKKDRRSLPTSRAEICRPFTPGGSNFPGSANGDGNTSGLT